MRQVSAKISTYTADVSGVCSALFELGGMTVIHDPSGCNSTYNTHDEPRWYDQDSLVFISGLTQMDAILGNDEKLIRDILRAARDLHPAFISLVRTPVPLLNGTDFEGIAMEIQQRSGIPTLYFPTTGMKTYVSGAGMALEKIADFLADPDDKEKTGKFKDGKEKTGIHREGEEGSSGHEEGISVNILGATPLDFSIGSTMDSLRAWLQKKGYRIQSCMAMGSSLDEIRTSPEADISLVISSVGLPAARKLKRRFGIPYVIGFPAEEYGDYLDLEMKRICRMAGGDYQIKSPVNVEEMTFPEMRRGGTGDYGNEEKGEMVLIGEPVISISLARAIAMRTGIRPEVISPLETDSEILDWSGQNQWGRTKNVCPDRERTLAPGSVSCRQIFGEKAIMENISSCKSLIADPLYRPVSPEGAHFICLPHEAFSGRLFRDRIPDLVHALTELGIGDA